MAHKIDTPAARASLMKEQRETLKAGGKLRRSPYWHPVRTNRFVGWRWMTEGTTGNWVAKMQEGRKEVFQPLGTLAQVEDKDRFKVALEAAQAWFKSCEDAAEGDTIVPSKMTLRQVTEVYVKEQAKKLPHGPEAALSADRRLGLLVVAYADADGKQWIDRPVGKISAKEFQAWIDWMRALPVQKGANLGKARTVSTMNRDVTMLRAALNLSKKLHKITGHWKEVLVCDHKAEKRQGGGRRTKDVVLKPDERRRLIEAAQEVRPDIVPLLKASAMVPIRPGAYASALVEDYHADDHTLHIRRDKSGAGRDVTLGDDKATRDLYRDLTKRKTPKAHLFTDGAGKAWNASSWGKAVKEAARHAGLPSALTIYWLRHSRITDLIQKGKVKPMAIAKIAGTSLAMIEGTYHHLLADEAREALSSVAAY